MVEVSDGNGINLSVDKLHRKTTNLLQLRHICNKKFIFKPELLSIHSMKVYVYNLVRLGRISKQHQYYSMGGILL